MERDTWHVQTFVLPIAPAEEGLRLLHAEYADSNGILALLFIVVEEHNEIILYTLCKFALNLVTTAYFSCRFWVTVYYLHFIMNYHGMVKNQCIITVL